jgi:ATP phosphoribosyltransferase regulatory subunit
MSSEDNRWLVPDGIEDVLPQEAEQVEYWRRMLLEEFARWGYAQVLPPLVEFVQALLTGKASDLHLDTCQLVDQVSGRMMGVRSDMTPQVARIDAHRLKHTLPTRLCYAGEVLRARPSIVTGSRSPIQVGAELFGHAGVQSDIEVMELMLATCERVGLQDLTLVLGHVSIYRSLSVLAGFSAEQDAAAQAMLQRKSLPEWQQWCQQLPNLPNGVLPALLALPMLCGDATAVLLRAQVAFSILGTAFDAALSRLTAIVKHLTMTHAGLAVHLDLADLRGFQYHTGVVFGVIEAKRGRLIASGGRYDDVGAVFGRSRPATGFSLDLRQLLDLRLPVQPLKRKRVLAPAVADMSLVALIHQLRQEGHTVVIGFPDVDWASQKAECDVELVQESNRWVMR